MLSNHIIFCHPLLLTSVFPSIRVFSSKFSLPITWPKYWSFSFSIGTSNQYSWLISFRVDWFDFLAVQRDSKIFSSTTWSNPELSLLYCPTLTSVHDSWENRSFATWTFVGKVMSLLFNMLSRYVIAFLPRCKHLVCTCRCIAITICSDVGAQKNSQPLYPLLPHLFAMKWWDWMPWC